MPKYEIMQDSYIDDIPFVVGATYDDKESKHVPAPHWKPLDAEAKAICAKHGIVYTGEAPDSIEALTNKLQTDMKARDAREALAGQPEAIGKAVVSALQDAGVIKKTPARADI